MSKIGTDFDVEYEVEARDVGIGTTSFFIQEEEK
jgi:hypothetical protein